jgi:hypothetical protein
MEFASMFFWFVIFWFWAGVIKAMLEAKRQAKLQMLTNLDEITHRVKVEQHDDTFYWFDQDDGQFLGQGKDWDTIVSTVKSRFPKHIFFIQNQKENSIYKLHGPDWQLSKIEFSKNG